MSADKTLTEFIAQKRLSKTSYYDLRKRGLGPDETVYPGSRIIRISATAEQAWDERMAKAARTKAARLEAKRRHEIALIAGKAAAKSPRHVSKQAPRRKRGG